jgi:bifunctional DNA-binding transcriptional regulator/antitoxin component of YhaV-PrlF toxin-antitoxin module
MATIKITSKRQATFPAELCGDLGIEPGDQVTVEPQNIAGKKVWVIQPVKTETEDKWFGSLSNYAKGKSHNMDDIKASIVRGRKAE